MVSSHCSVTIKYCVEYSVVSSFRRLRILSRRTFFFLSNNVTVNLILNHTGSCFCSSFVSLSFSFMSNPRQQTCPLLVIDRSDLQTREPCWPCSCDGEIEVIIILIALPCLRSGQWLDYHAEFACVGTVCLGCESFQHVIADTAQFFPAVASKGLVFNSTFKIHYCHMTVLVSK